MEKKIEGYVELKKLEQYRAKKCHYFTVYRESEPAFDYHVTLSPAKEPDYKAMWGGLKDSVKFDWENSTTVTMKTFAGMFLSRMKRLLAKHTPQGNQSRPDGTSPQGFTPSDGVKKVET